MTTSTALALNFIDESVLTSIICLSLHIIERSQFSPPFNCHPPRSHTWYCTRILANLSLSITMHFDLLPQHHPLNNILTTYCRHILYFAHESDTIMIIYWHSHDNALSNRRCHICGINNGQPAVDGGPVKTNSILPRGPGTTYYNH